jgi:predicted transcriptional regulator
LISMASPLSAPAIRHSILDLAPLEVDCLNALWPRGEATVREIQEALAPTRPRAYTTIMTILDRLAQKGVVQRRKTGRAWTYRPNVSEREARSRAVSQLVNSFFDGSPEALTAHLASTANAGQSGSAPVPETRVAPANVRQKSEVDVPAAKPEEEGPAGLETTLL